MTELGSISTSMYTELVNYMKPNSPTQSIASNSKGLKLQDVAKTVDVSENVENLIVKDNKIDTYYDNLVTSGVLENIGNSTTATLSTIVASAVSNGMSVQDACNVKNGITVYSSCTKSVPSTVSVEVDV